MINTAGILGEFHETQVTNDFKAWNSSVSKVHWAGICLWRDAGSEKYRSCRSHRDQPLQAILMGLDW